MCLYYHINVFNMDFLVSIVSTFAKSIFMKSFRLQEIDMSTNNYNIFSTCAMQEIDFLHIYAMNKNIDHIKLMHFCKEEFTLEKIHHFIFRTHTFCRIVCFLMNMWIYI